MSRDIISPQSRITYPQHQIIISFFFCYDFCSELEKRREEKRREEKRREREREEEKEKRGDYCLCYYYRGKKEKGERNKREKERKREEREEKRTSIAARELSPETLPFAIAIISSTTLSFSSFVLI